MIRIRIQSRSLLRPTLWALIALAIAAGAASAAPKHHGHHPAKTTPAEDKFIRDCTFERTGPDGGIELKDALKLCTGIVKHNHRIDKSKARAAKAIAQCRDEVFVACEDTMDRDHDDGECSAEALSVELAACASEVK